MANRTATPLSRCGRASRPRATSSPPRHRAGKPAATRWRDTPTPSTVWWPSCSPARSATRRRRSCSRSAATAAGISACTPTSICWCSSPARWTPSDEGALGRTAPSAVGSRARRSATRCASSTDFARIEADNPEFLLALIDARPIAGDRDLFDRFTTRVSARRRCTRTCVDALLALTDERHAPFNATFYQLEPDVKDAPGGLRDLGGRAHDRPADRSGAAPAGAVGLGAARRGRGVPAARRGRSCTSTRRRNQNVLSHAMQEKGGRRCWAIPARCRRRASSG